ncbi:MAG: filamentous hemagglutinin N-terminal domain-containing protein [Betaproteobacteria bacterium]
MNKNLYRLVFNKARGLLMAVAESAVGQTKSAGTTRASRPAASTGASLLATLRATTYAVLCALGMVCATSTYAQVIADPSAPHQQQPTILNTPTGVPQVNVQIPSAAGVSRNTYSQFDVQSQGVILNNARTNTQTQLGGWIQGNPWLATGTARVILNEVNSKNPTLLRGYIEVGGDRAQVIIANPNGITCDGCGYINANRATLTTGTPIMNGGSLEGYLVQRGAITIQGAGMDASGTDFTDIIARAVQVNAGIWANDLKVTAGANLVSADHTQITPVSGGGAAPTIAIDVAQLGGMYAGKIRLIGTESGVGVRNAGLIGASAGEIIITADGHLQNRGKIISASAARITASSFDNQHGEVQAAGDVTITTGSGALNNTGSLLRSGAALSIAAGSVINASTNSIDQGIEGFTVNIAANHIDNASGVIRADDAVTLIGNGALDNTLGLLSSGGLLQVMDSSAGIGAGRSLLVTNSGGQLTAGHTLTIDVASLTGDGSVLSHGDLAIKLTNGYTHTGELQANGAASLDTSGIMINQSTLLAGTSLTIIAAGIDNQLNGEISAGTVQLSAGTNALSNRGLIDGQIVGIDVGALTNLGTRRIYGDYLSIGATTLTNDAESGLAPVIAARVRLDIGVQTLTNRDNALIFSAGDLAIGGALNSTRRATGPALVLNNHSATIEALGSLDIAVGQINNTDAHFSTLVAEVARMSVQEYELTGSPNRYAPGQISIYNDEVDHLVTPEGVSDTWIRYDYTRVTTETQVSTAAPGQILAGSAMTLTADSVLNDKSRIIAGAALTAAIGTLQNLGASGDRTTLDVGSATNFFRIQQKGRDDQGVASAAYTPAATIQTISVRPALYQQNTTPAGSATQIASFTASTLTPGTAGASAGAVNITLSNSSLFTTHANPTASYLVETDPRFANYRTWLSSDYMLQQLSLIRPPVKNDWAMASTNRNWCASRSRS